MTPLETVERAELADDAVRLNHRPSKAKPEDLLCLAPSTYYLLPVGRHTLQPQLKRIHYERCASDCDTTSQRS